MIRFANCFWRTSRSGIWPWATSVSDWPTVWAANLRYRGSVEDRVHAVLADRLESIHQLFGQIPDTLEDVWVKVALADEEEAQRLIDRTAATRNPFDAKYSKVEDADWESCNLVLDPTSVREQLARGWQR